MTHKILLQGVRLFAYHGVGADERAIGTYYLIDLALTTDFRKAMQTDEICDTINYAEVYETLYAQMQQPQRLLEHVANQILKALFHQFPAVSHISLRLIKENPPIPAIDCQGCGVEIEMNRTEI